MGIWYLLGWIVAGGIAAAAVIALLSVDAIVEWFRGRLSDANRNVIGITVLEHLHNGRYKVVQGVFNQTTQEVLEQRVIEAEQLDGELLAAHDENGVAVWTA